MNNVAYYRVSSVAQTTAIQRAAMKATGIKINKEFEDLAVSGGVPAAHRAGFAKLLAYVREGDTVHVAALDRLGRDALDVQSTVRGLFDRGVILNVQGLGVIAKGVGEIVLAVLAQVADMEKTKINERTEAGRAVARELLASTGKTQHGKTSMGRPVLKEAADVADWRKANQATQAATAAHWGISMSTVKRYCASSGE